MSFRLRISRVETKPKGTALFGTMPDLAKLLADREHNLIIDEVLFNDEALKKYAQSLRNHTVYYVGVFCDLDRMQEREILRRDRHLGLSNDQINRVHMDLKSHYDFKVDTTSISPFKSAEAILAYVESTADPQSFNAILRAAIM